LPTETDKPSTLKTPAVAVATLGCKVNQCESEGIIEELAVRGFQIVPFAQPADIYIINTCTVTKKTDYQSRQLIHRAIRKNPEAEVMVTGCYAQRAPEEIRSIAGVRFVFGNAEKKRIPETAARTQSAHEGAFVGDIRKEKTIAGPWATTSSFHTRAFLKIQDGCDAFCSYCIIPYTRGPSRSLSAEEVMDKLSLFAAHGFREVVLTGIHLGLWGHDLKPGGNLHSLLRKIADSRPIERIRLSSIEPREISNEIIMLLKDSNVFCRHLHIPLQNGSDKILQAMRRNYSSAFFRELIIKLHETFPEMALGTDVIAGFPGETDGDFAETETLLEKLPIAYLHAFPFSIRPGTPAAAMAEQIPEDVKKGRVKRLREIGDAKRRRFAEQFIGKRMDILIEKRFDKEKGFPIGLSDNYIPTAVSGEGLEINSIVNVIPESFNGKCLIAKIPDVLVKNKAASKLLKQGSVDV
jgi:threonylcarbamoyladenosine tRNA methylthiotransferase MtaB